MPERSARYMLHHNELLTDEVQEVISYRPHWIVRKGNIFFLLIILLLLAMTWVIKYPDMISASAKLEAINPPKLISAKVEGKLLKIFVSNEQTVKKGQSLGYMESTAEYEQVIILQAWVDSVIKYIQDDRIEVVKDYPLPKLIELGELQTGYQQFQNDLEITKQTLASGYYKLKRNAIQKDLNYLSGLKSNSQQQKELIAQDKELNEKEYKAYEALAKEKVIAPLELNQYKSKLISGEKNLKDINSQITNTDITSHSKKKELLDLQKQVTDLHQQFYSSLLTLKSEIEKWVLQYVLIAPEDGKVLFLSSLQENILINSGQGLFYVQPDQTSYYAELLAGQEGLGKIKKGQPVMVKVESYPASEFGYLPGTISYISNIPNRNDSFMIKVDFAKGLKTNFGKNIFFRNGLKASAEVVTDNRRLSDRLIGQLRQVLKR